MKIRNFLAAISLSALAGVAAAQSSPAVEVYKSPYCGCCGKWVEHLKKAGFQVKVNEVDDIGAARRRLGMPDKYASCHTSKVGGYLVEGHVPATDIRKLLKEKPKALGIAAPGMPQGSPGMETPTPQPYDVVLVRPDGSNTVFVRH